jgi:hypothetical protein
MRIENKTYESLVNDKARLRSNAKYGLNYIVKRLIYKTKEFLVN